MSQRHTEYTKEIPLFHNIYQVILCISLCYKNDNRSTTLKPIFQNFHIKSLNSHFSVDNEKNVTKLTGHVLCIIFEGSVSQNFDVGLGYLFYVM